MFVSNCPSCSQIDTPELFEKLKAGTFPVNEEDLFYITRDAHPDVLSQPKHFANSKYNFLVFIHNVENYIIIVPGVRKVVAEFRSPQSLLGIPVDYKYYVIINEVDANVSDTDIDYILQWNDAKELAIVGGSLLPLQLQERISTTNVLKSLTKFEASIAKQTYKQLRLVPFLNAFESLNEIFFQSHDSITTAEYKEFLKLQTIPKNWVCRRNPGDSIICLKRNNNKKVNRLFSFLAKELGN